MVSHCTNPFCQLTSRQMELLKHLATNPGVTNRDLARCLHVTEGTVKKHFQAIYRVLGVHNRSECLVIWLRTDSVSKLG